MGDSPGGSFSEVALNRAYEKSGYKDLDDETGASLNFKTGEERVSFFGGRISNNRCSDGDGGEKGPSGGESRKFAI